MLQIVEERIDNKITAIDKQVKNWQIIINRFERRNTLSPSPSIERSPVFLK